MKHLALPLIACLIGQPWSASLAQGGGLIFPSGSENAVVLSLQTVPIDRELPDILQVFVGPVDACCAGKTPIAGTYDLSGNTLTFDPAFDFIAGQPYTVQSRDGAVSLSSFVIAPERGLRVPEVVAIYPSGPTLPENTLRFYIQFSTPMMPHRADEFIKLMDATGKADTAAFMSFTQELWSEDRTQLTLLMDPGRIKRGVAQNLTLGPALLEGHQYSIVVDGGWPSALGGQDVSRFQQSFSVSPALRNLPDVGLWRFQPPTRDTDMPLIITFDRPFDQQLAQGAITVNDADGRRISGNVVLEKHEHQWQFKPDAPWSASKIQIVVDTRLEDVAGNNFRDLLDHALGTSSAADNQDMITIDLSLDP